VAQVLTTPYQEAKELKASGASSDAIAAHLHTRGLDAEAIVLLLNAIGAPPLTAPLPASEPVAASPQVTTLGPPPAATCTRCGAFLDAWVPVLGRPYCTTCGARPDVNYPRAYRDAHWGKRDAFTWFLGVTGMFGLMAGTIALTGPGFVALPLWIGSVGSLLFWSGAKIGRPALVVTTIVAVLVGMATTQFPNVVTIGLTVAAMRSARTKLFFEIEVSEAELDAAWRAEHDNRPAQYSRALGFIALATMVTWIGRMWQFGAATLVVGLLAGFTGVIGLRNVNPYAQPPVGRKGAAMTGIVTGVIAMLAAALYLALPYF
jgi:hypothetical protein